MMYNKPQQTIRSLYGNLKIYKSYFYLVIFTNIFSVILNITKKKSSPRNLKRKLCYTKKYTKLNDCFEYVSKHLVSFGVKKLATFEGRERSAYRSLGHGPKSCK